MQTNASLGRDKCGQMPPLPQGRQNAGSMSGREGVGGIFPGLVKLTPISVRVLNNPPTKKYGAVHGTRERQKVR